MTWKRLCNTMIIIAWLASVFTVNAYQIDCPKEITFKEKVEDKPDGWDVSEDKTVTSFFLNLELYYDNPVKKAAQVPVSGTSDGFKQQLVWRVNNAEDTAPYYAVCVYAESGIAITKKIDPSMKSCWVIYSEDENVKQGTLHCSVSESKNRY